VEPFYLDKTHYSLGIYYIPGLPNIRHPGSDQTTAVLLGDMLSSIGDVRVTAPRTPVSGFSEAFRLARLGQQDYFVLLSFEEGDREVNIRCQVYVSRTGSAAAEFSVFRTGNDYYSSAVRGAISGIQSLFPVRGKLIARNGSQALIDLGTVEGIAPDQQFSIIRKGRLAVADEGIGSLYAESDVLGTFTVTSAGEDVSQGALTQNGFYDRINPGDEVLLIAAADPAEDTAASDGVSTGAAPAGAAPAEAVTVVPKNRIPRLINLLKTIE
jgi:hypothetical protein